VRADDPAQHDSIEHLALWHDFADGEVTMTTSTFDHQLHLYEMMERLGIEPGAGVLPRLSLPYATALRRCEACHCKEACRDWLEHAAAAVNFAPRFCVITDILFELQCDQAGPRRVH